MPRGAPGDREADGPATEHGDVVAIFVGVGHGSGEGIAGAARARGRAATLTVVRRGLLLLACLGLSGCGGSAERQPGDRGESIAWNLADVSDDGRVVSVFHEAPHCRTVPGRARVAEDAGHVKIRIPELHVLLAPDVVCTADLRFTTTRVRLAAPLGARRLEQPGGGAPRGRAAFGSNCPRLLRARADAPLFDVPAFARERARCAKPVPASVLALPILRRPASPRDRLTAFERQDLQLETTFLKPARARSAPLGRRGTVVLVPGAEGSCALFREARFRGRTCATTAQLVRRGLFAEESSDACDDVPVGRRRVDVAGIAPPGVRRVRLTRGSRTLARVPVRAGAYRATVVDARSLVVGAVTLPLREAVAEC